MAGRDMKEFEYSNFRFISECRKSRYESARSFKKNTRGGRFSPVRLYFGFRSYEIPADGRKNKLVFPPTAFSCVHSKI